MKIMITMTFLLLASHGFAQTKTKCFLPEVKHIESISIVSDNFNAQGDTTNGHVEINYIDGNVETLEPLHLVEGTFNQVIYNDTISSSAIKPHHRVLTYVSSQRVGDVKISFTCTNVNSDFSCIGRGGQTPEAIADININGILLSTKKCSFKLL